MYNKKKKVKNIIKILKVPNKKLIKFNLQRVYTANIIQN